MVKIGSYYYPSRKVTPLLEAIRAIGDKLGSNSASVGLIASTLGYKSSNNGAFLHTLSDIRKYGLVEGRGKEVKLSELAQKILAPNKGEETEAIKEDDLSYAFVEGYIRQVRKNPSDFSVALQKVTGINRLEADAIKDEIGKLYIDAVSKISNDKGMESGDNMNVESQAINQTPTLLGNSDKFALFSAEGISLKIVNDKSHLQTADSFIKFLLASITDETKTKKKTKEDEVSST